MNLDIDNWSGDTLLKDWWKEVKSALEALCDGINDGAYTKLLDDADLNNLRDGHYKFTSSLVNNPCNAQGILIQRTAWDSTGVIQIAIHGNHDRIYMRNRAGGVWSDWGQFATFEDMENAINDVKTEISTLDEKMGDKADKTQYASITQAGLIKLHSGNNTNRSGIIVSATDGTAYIATNSSHGTIRDGAGQIGVAAATESEIDAREQTYKPIVPSTLKYAVQSVAGQFNTLQTTNKTNLVYAINEVFNKISDVIGKVSYTQLADSADINDIGDGYYEFASGLTNNPCGSQGILIQQHSYSTVTIQVAISGANPPKIYTRAKMSDTWYDWVSIATANELKTEENLRKAEDNYLLECVNELYGEAEDKVDKTQYASTAQAGVVKLKSDNEGNASGLRVEDDGSVSILTPSGSGIIFNNAVSELQDGVRVLSKAIGIDCATNDEIDQKSSICKPIVPHNLDYAIKSVVGQFDDLKVADKTNLVNAINAEFSARQGQIGILSNLKTSNKTNLVNAVNEVDNKFNYSDTLTQIGTWIDGTPIWRIAFQHAWTEDEKRYIFDDMCADVLHCLNLVSDHNHCFVINDYCMSYSTSPCFVDDRKMDRDDYDWNFRSIYDSSAQDIEWYKNNSDGVYGWIDFVTAKSNLK